MQQQMSWAMQGQPLHGMEQNSAQMPVEQLHHMYHMQRMQGATVGDVMQMQTYPNGAAGTSFSDAIQMQHYMMQSQSTQSSYVGQAVGHVKNHALEALAAALDRQEIDM